MTAITTYLIELAIITTVSGLCPAELDYIKRHEGDCHTLRWRKKTACPNSIEPFELLICNGSLYRYSLSGTEANSLAATFSGLYCNPTCMICINGSEPGACLFYNSNNANQYEVCNGSIGYGKEISCGNDIWKQPEYELWSSDSEMQRYTGCSINYDNLSLNACAAWHGNRQQSSVRVDCCNAFLIDSLISHKRLLAFCSYSRAAFLRRFDTPLSSVCQNISQSGIIKIQRSVVEVHARGSSECSMNNQQINTCPDKSSWIALKQVLGSITVGFINDSDTVVIDAVNSYATSCLTIMNLTDHILYPFEGLNITLIAKDQSLQSNITHIFLATFDNIECINLTVKSSTSCGDNKNGIIELRIDESTRQYYIISYNNLTIIKPDSCMKTDVKFLVLLLGLLLGFVSIAAILGIVNFLIYRFISKERTKNK